MNNVQLQVFITDLKKGGLPMPEPEYEFHPTRKWRFDFAWPGNKIAVEVEGGVYGMGKPCKMCGQRKQAGHSRPENIKRDIDKYNEAQRLGWIVVRVLPSDLNKLTFIKTLKQYFTNARQQA